MALQIGLMLLMVALFGLGLAFIGFVAKQLERAA